jgi:hypothetical protein
MRVLRIVLLAVVLALVTAWFSTGESVRCFNKQQGPFEQPAFLLAVLSEAKAPRYHSLAGTSGRGSLQLYPVKSTYLGKGITYFVLKQVYLTSDVLRLTSRAEFHRDFQIRCGIFHKIEQIYYVDFSPRTVDEASQSMLGSVPKEA